MYNMEASISFRIQSVDGKGLLGQRRHDQRIGKQPDYVDADREHLNAALYRAEGWNRIPGSTVKEDTERAHKLMNSARDEIEARAKRKTKTGRYWRTAILTFSHEAQDRLAEQVTLPHDEAKAAFEDFAERHGIKLLTVDFHGDESALHYHASFEGVNADGYALRLDRKQLSQEQDHAAEKFAALGLVRGKRKIDRIADGEDPAAFINRSVKELHEQLPAELEELKAKIEKNERLAEKARAKASGENAKAEKAAKNAQTYERRAEAARQKLEQLQSRLTASETELETVEQAVAQKKTKIASLKARLQSLSAA